MKCTNCGQSQLWLIKELYAQRGNVQIVGNTLILKKTVTHTKIDFVTIITQFLNLYLGRTQSSS